MSTIQSKPASSNGKRKKKNANSFTVKNAKLEKIMDNKDNNMDNEMMKNVEGDMMKNKDTTMDNKMIENKDNNMDNGMRAHEEKSIDDKMLADKGVIMDDKMMANEGNNIEVNVDVEENENENEDVEENNSVFSEFTFGNDPKSEKQYGIEEYYLKDGYCKEMDGESQIYAKDEKGNEIYFEDEAGEKTYAHKSIKVGDKCYRVEYLAKDNKGRLQMIYDHGVPRYPINLDTDEVIFPKTKNTGEKYYKHQKTQQRMYPKNKYGQEFYRKDKEGNQIPIDNIYAKDKNGDEMYPKMSNGDEYYLKNMLNSAENGAKKKINGEFVQYYAKKANGDEYYPKRFADFNPQEDIFVNNVPIPSDSQ